MIGKPQFGNGEHIRLSRNQVPPIRLMEMARPPRKLSKEERLAERIAGKLLARLLGDDEIWALSQLKVCTFGMNRSVKRFVHGQHEVLTERQRRYLWAIAWTYRRQLPELLREVAAIYSDRIGLSGRRTE